MIIKIRIKTPIGQATGTEKKLRYFLLPIGTVPKIEVNEANSEIIWVVDVNSRNAVKIYKNVGRFGAIVENILTSRMFKKRAKTAIGEEGIKELEEMLKNQTTCEIIKG